MIPSPLVPVEGALARPRATPLDHVPPFGREWRFRGAPGTGPGRNCLATLTTSCIDVDRPHRECRWQPLSVAASLPASAGLPVPSAVVPGRRLRHSARHARDRRAMYVVCWSIGALGIIGWLIGAYDRPAGSGPAYAIQAAGSTPDHAATSTGTIRIAAAQPDTSTHAMPQHKVATPVANTVESPPAKHRVALRPATLHPQATADVRHAAPASPRRATGQRTANAPTRTPVVPRLAAHQPLQRAPFQRDAANTGTRDRLARPLRTADTRDTRDSFDDPATLIAMANALRAAQPARPAHPPAGVDWTSHLSHRRVTDVPDAFAH
ncbi:hypothetical protein DF018_28825 [Burkholderia cenocepacia]|nr:hypothetical protein DF133_03550 [Burkholderia cenocepacia]RQV15437.1 hypothetical protein DF132_28455 [Burkholderia cenocepacia]RQV16603.1 hypothetical protein DF039_17810 [Burkholderia cenocepacia]RQV61170.1 hypothetical protein DF018_28825 [Burkholderia cenocepacia]